MSAISELPGRPAKPVTTMNRGALRLSLRTANGLGVAELSHADEARPWLTGPELDWGPWRIWFCGPDGTSPSYMPGNGEYAGATEETTPDGNPCVRAAWRLPLGRDAVAGVRVTVAAGDSGDGFALTDWRLAVDVPAGWGITKVEFPVLDGIAAGDGVRAIAPAGWGLEAPFEPGYLFEGDYPSCTAGVQCMALHRGTTGLYLGAHDGAANLKSFRLAAGAVAGKFSVSLVPARPADAGAAHRWELPFPACVGVFRNGCHGAAQVYRRFAQTTEWFQKGDPARAPEWLRRAGMWLRPDGSPADNVEVTRRGLEYFGATTTPLHWYRWHQIPYDTHYPEYFPPLPGFAEAIAAMQREGTRVMPYINGRLWDPASESWAERNAARSAARTAAGQCYSEVYGSRIPNNVMCPTTPLWQGTVSDLVERMCGELGVDGVYIDQICAAAGVPCHAENHGHAPGGGTFWAEGYRAMLQEVRRRLPEGRILTTEENAECWLDQFDALLVLNTPNHMGTPVPFFPAVYADRCLTFGFLYYPPDEPANGLPFRLKNALALLWGSQPGWIQPNRILADGAEGEAAFLREMARVRADASDLLVGARFLGEAPVAGDMPRLTGRGSGSFGGSYPIDVPAVLATAWLSPRGGRFVIAVNLSDSPVEARVPLPRLREGFEGWDTAARCEACGWDSPRTVTVPAAGALVIREA